MEGGGFADHSEVEAACEHPLRSDALMTRQPTRIEPETAAVAPGGGNALDKNGC